MKRILWGITGSGDRIADVLHTMDIIQQREDLKVYVVLSKSAEQMLRRYDLWAELNSKFKKVTRETNANVPFIVGPLQVGHYDVLIVAPLTANSTAKIAHGIADTLVTNAVSQTLKGTTPVILYPVDQKPGEVQTKAPDGIVYTIRTRQVDLDNTDILRKMEGVIVVSSPDGIPRVIDNILD
ncbi:MAG: archaeoflavoprotein AfpA [Candidatus Thorarchaeota archaeon]|nr:archaeoflavoprotein AfpA [Candidatus Thorarchaeota archaeon]